VTDSRERFGPRAEKYAAYRPSHAPEAVDAVLEGLGDPEKIVIADVGAGTGLSSRLFADRGATVIAIEPNATMRAKAQSHERVTWLDRSAEATGLPDKSVDVAVACQAFHWFATPQTMAEFVRIARRRTAMLQYERDERDPFSEAYGAIVRAYATDDTEEMRRRGMEAFVRLASGYAGLACSQVNRSAGIPASQTSITRLTAYSVQTMDIEALLGRAASSSYLPASGEMGERLAADLRALFDRFERDGYVTMHLVTYALTADLGR
jgi:SAM-dependent methyltransferase